MAIITFIFVLVFVLAIMIFLFPKILYVVTALYYFLQGSPEKRVRKKGTQFSLNDFKEFKDKKILLK